MKIFPSLSICFHSGFYERLEASQTGKMFGWNLSHYDWNMEPWHFFEAQSPIGDARHQSNLIRRYRQLFLIFLAIPNLLINQFPLVYNSRRSNVYEQVSNHHHRSLNGSMASGLTEATSTFYLEINSEIRFDSIVFHRQRYGLFLKIVIQFPFNLKTNLYKYVIRLLFLLSYSIQWMNSIYRIHPSISCCRT